MNKTKLNKECYHNNMLLNAYFMTCLIPREIETTLNHWVVINKVILFKNEVSVNVRRKETGVFIAIVFVGIY